MTKQAMFAVPFIRSAYNYDRDSASDESALSEFEPTRTQQSSKDEADINVIVKRFGISGQLPQGIRAPTFADYDDVYDYRSLLEVKMEADRSFMMLPAEVRGRFLNDPQKFVEFCSDSGNLEEMRKMGLAPIPEVIDHGGREGSSKPDKAIGGDSAKAAGSDGRDGGAAGGRQGAGSGGG